MFETRLDTSALTGLFRRLRDGLSDMTPFMRLLGEHYVETTKRRFATSTAPDGQKWAPNKATTILAYLARYRSSYSKKTGKLTSAGANRAIAKKPLVGETHALETSTHYRAERGFVEVRNPMKYARVQQEGAAARSFAGGRSPWGDIPARPFIGLSADDREFMSEEGEALLRSLAESRGS